MGGMSAFIPIANDAAANKAVTEKVRLDKEREVTAGCDGTWVAHPALIPIALQVFDAHMKTPNQITRRTDAVDIKAKDLLGSRADLQGGVTNAGVAGNIDVGLGYLESWLRGLGCVPLHNLMEVNSHHALLHARPFIASACSLAFSPCFSLSGCCDG